MVRSNLTKKYLQVIVCTLPDAKGMPCVSCPVGTLFDRKHADALH